MFPDTFFYDMIIMIMLVMLIMIIMFQLLNWGTLLCDDIYEKICAAAFLSRSLLQKIWSCGIKCECNLLSLRYTSPSFEEPWMMCKFRFAPLLQGLKQTTDVQVIFLLRQELFTSLYFTIYLQGARQFLHFHPAQCPYLIIVFFCTPQHFFACKLYARKVRRFATKIASRQNSVY